MCAYSKVSFVLVIVIAFQIIKRSMEVIEPSQSCSDPLSQELSQGSKLKKFKLQNGVTMKVLLFISS